MSTKWKAILVVAALLVAGIPVGHSLARNLYAGEKYVKQLLVLMDLDKNGKVSKHEFMTYMEAEFTRLDVNGDGELDVHELRQLNVTPHYLPPHR
ncbi:MAG: hypothetical protein ACLPID_10465 [Beijerinckiaceae bacterium]